ncbi:MAG: hypothetical protein AMXMBFR57_37160 [Acidimicrobiia bacterium]
MLAEPIQADVYEPWCDERGAECAAMCGTTVTHTYHYTYWDPYCGFDYASQMWWGCQRAYGTWSWGSGVQNFECDEVSQSSLCQCAY